MTELDVNLWPGPVQPIAVLPTAVDVKPFMGSGTLLGWSLREAGSEAPASANGSVVAPGAGATIATTAALAAGTYDIQWTVELAGAAAAADLNNFQLFNGAVAVVQSANAGAAGVYPQPNQRLVVTQGSTVSVKVIGAGTAGVTYTAEIVATPSALFGMSVELQAGNMPLGESAADVQESDTQWFGPQGVAIEQFVQVHVIAGTVTGTLYIQPNY